jgi:hypothetical protein
MTDWRRATRQALAAVREAAEPVQSEARTSALWVKRALDGDRDTLLRTLCFCGENTACAALAATQRAQAATEDAFRQIAWGSSLAVGIVRIAGEMTGLACRGVIATAVTFDVITSLARTEDVHERS